MPKLYRIIFLLFTVTLLSSNVFAAQSEVLSDVRYMKRGGVPAVHIDFAFPVRYVSHFPAKQGDTLTINLEFSTRFVRDISQLPLLQSITAPDSGKLPLEEVTYLTENGRPILVLQFSRTVRYRVSQVTGQSSLMVFLPDKRDVETVSSGLNIPAVIPRSKGKGKVDKKKLEKRYRGGRKAIQKGENKIAVEIFTALLSLPGHKYMKESLEYLGLARERAGQTAHAKAAYEEYLRRYPKDKESKRIKMRLDDILSGKKVPKQRLKKSTRSDRAKRETTSDFFASISQFYDIDINRIEIDDQGNETENQFTGLDTQISFDWRIRKGNYDIRNSFFGSYQFDLEENISDDGFEIGSFYSRIKNSKDGIYATLGRQSARIAGIGGKFDGAYFGYDIKPTVRVNVAHGYVVRPTEKTKVQDHMPFNVISVDFNEFIPDWEIGPYILEEQVDGFVNRSLLGTEIRYFHKKGDIFGVYEYDTEFSKTNIALIRAKYLLQKNSTINFSFDRRRSPLLELDLIKTMTGRYDPTISEILDSGFTVNQLRNDFVLKKSGHTENISVSLSHSFSPTLHLTAEVRRGEGETPTVTVPSDPLNVLTLKEILDGVLNNIESGPTPIKTKLKENSLQLISSQAFHRHDSAIFSIRKSTEVNYTLDTYSFEYRRPFNNRLRVNTRIDYRQRIPSSVVSTNGTPVIKLTRLTPFVKLNYRYRNNMRLYLEVGYEIEDTTDPQVSDVTLRSEEFIAYLGYTWDFL